MTKRIAVFQELGDNIADIIKKKDDDRLLKGLEYCRSFENFRNQILKLNQLSIQLGNDKTLVSLEAYFQDLFPDGYKSWKETRDILLFRIYETLHGWLKEKNYLPPDNEDQDINTEESKEEKDEE